MAQRTTAYLKNKFLAGAQPPQQDYWDLLDSFINITDSAAASTEFNIKSFNAVGNGTADDVAALIAANAAAVVAGGGTIYFPVGTYRTGDNVAFDSKVQLRLEKGAVLQPAAGTVISNVDLVAAPNAPIFTGVGTVTLKSGSLYNVKWWGALGDGVTNDYAAVNRARAAMESVPDYMLLFPRGTYVLGTSISFAATTQLTLANAILSPNTGQTVTILGMLSAPMGQIFAGLGTISLGAKIQPVIPQWWGAVGDGVTDDYAAINKASLAVQAQGAGKLLFRDATYIIGTSHTFGANVTVELQSGAKLSPNTAIVLTFTAPPILPFMQVFAGAGTESFLAPPLDVYPQWWGALGTGADDTAAIIKMFGSLPSTGGHVVFSRTATYYSINAEIAISAKNGITVDGVGDPTIFLATTANWGAVSAHALHFTNCSHTHVRGITFDGNGAANGALVTAQHFMLAFDYTYSDLLDATLGISDVEVDECLFKNYFSSALGVRSCRGVSVHNNEMSQGYQEAASGARYPINVARCNDVAIFENVLDGGSNSDSTHGTRSALILVHPGGSTTKWDAAINWCHVVDYQTLKLFTAPASASATSDAVVSYTSVTGVTGDTPVGNDFFFMCKDAGDGGASAGFLNGDQMKVISQDTVAKTFTVRLMDGTENAGVARNWGGQKVYFCSLNTSRFCQNVEVSNNVIRNSYGLFLLGCKHFSIAGNRAANGIDIALDTEWCMDGSIVGNQTDNATGNTGIACIAFARDITISGNTCNAGGKLADYLQYTWYEVAANILIIGNVFHAPIMIAPFGGLENVIDGIEIVGNQIIGAPNSTYGQGAVDQTTVNVKTNDTGGMIRSCLITANHIKGANQRLIGVSGIDGLTITHNVMSNSGYDAIVDETTATRQSKRVYVDHNIFNNIGHRFFSGMAIYRAAATSPADTPRIGAGNVWRNIDSSLDGTQNFYYDNNTATLPISEWGASKTWDPANLAAGAFDSTTITVAGAKVGDMAVAGLTTLVGAGMILSAVVSSANTVTVMLYNNDTGAHNLASGTLRVRVWRS